jgi:hypothetical protein
MAATTAEAVAGVAVTGVTAVATIVAVAVIMAVVAPIVISAAIAEAKSNAGVSVSVVVRVGGSAVITGIRDGSGIRHYGRSRIDAYSEVNTCLGGSGMYKSQRTEKSEYRKS